MIVYLNGKFVDGRQASISIWDAGFLFGEGVFTTLRLDRGIAPGLEEHWRRLSRQAETLDIPFSLSLEETRTIVSDLARKNHLLESEARLRITVTRGGNPDQPLPIVPNPAQLPTTLFTVMARRPALEMDGPQGIAVITLGPEFLRSFPEIKSLNFLSPVMALRAAHRQGCHEAIILDETGQLTEGAVSNLFLVKNNELLTPEDNGRLLAGKTRRRVLELAGKHGLVVRETNLERQDLEEADEVFICNSIRQIVPVISVDGRQVNHGRPGRVTVQILDWCRQSG